MFNNKITVLLSSMSLETPFSFVFLRGHVAVDYTSARHYVMFFTGDFNARSQNWWTDGNINNEGIAIDNLLSALDLTQIICEHTNFEKKKKPSCIDLIFCDQPNIIVDSGVRPSLDPFCKHQITYCNINFNMPSALALQPHNLSEELYQSPHGTNT